MMQVVLVPIARYETPKSLPTCCRNVETSMCVFYRHDIEGIKPVCKSPSNAFQAVTLYAKNGWIVPHEKCPVWAKNVIVL